MAAECIRLKNLIKGWDAHLYTLSLSLSLSLFHGGERDGSKVYALDTASRIEKHGK